MHLKTSFLWKQLSIDTPSLQNDRLEKVYCNGHEYIGCFVDNSSASLTLIRRLADDIKRQMAIYCPKFETKNLNVVAFRQVFIA